MDTNTFDATVSNFYRAAAGLESWDAALTSVQTAFGARVAFLHTADARDGQILSIHQGGLASNDSVLDYVRDYHRMDPRRDVILNDLPNAIGRWWHCHEHFDDRFVARQRFYRDFMQAYDARYTSRVILAPGGPTDSVLTAFALELPASRGVLSVDEQEVLRRLGSHMHEALRAHQRVRSLVAQALAGHQLLQSFAYPMWLIDEQRFVSFENAAASKEVEAEQRVGRRGAYLALTRGSNDQLLTEKLMVLCRSGHGASAVLDLRPTLADPPACFIFPCWHQMRPWALLENGCGCWPPCSTLAR